MGLSRRGPAGTAGILALTLSLVACYGVTDDEVIATRAESSEASPDSGDDGANGDEGVVASGDGEFSNYEGFIDEFRETAQQLDKSLPEGYPLISELNGEWDRSGRYEAGAGAMQAAFQWQCAWISTYVQSKDGGDADGASHAVDRLAEWTQLPAVAPHIDDASKKSWADDLITPTREGNDTLLLELGTDCVDGL